MTLAISQEFFSYGDHTMPGILLTFFLIIAAIAAASSWEARQPIDLGLRTLKQDRVVVFCFGVPGRSVLVSDPASLSEQWAGAMGCLTSFLFPTMAEVRTIAAYAVVAVAPALCSADKSSNRYGSL